MGLFGERIADAASGPGGDDYKTRLQELAAQRFEKLPRYQVHDEGPDHAKRFFATVLLGGEPHGSGEGGSKKQAEQAAARAAWRWLSAQGDEAAEGEPGEGAPNRRHHGRIGDGGQRMPELPEVEVVRRDLEKEVVGKKIKSVDVDGMRSIRRYRQRKLFTSELDGRKITAVSPAGQVPVLKLDDGNALIVHLGMSGQLLRAKTRARRCRSTPTSRSRSRRAGSSASWTRGRSARCSSAPFDGIDQDVEELAHLGIDPLESAMSWDYFGELVAQRHAKLKPR